MDKQYNHKHKWIKSGFDLLGNAPNSDDPAERDYYTCWCGAKRTTLERADKVLREVITESTEA